MREVYVVGLARTAFGSFQGSLSLMPAPRLGAVAIEGAIHRAGIQRNMISEVIMGNVLSSGMGQAPARQAAIYAGIPDSVPALTINKVCGSGMKSIMLGVQSIRLGDSDVVVAGGMESMSQTPYLIHQVRTGFRMGNQALIDSMIYDGLWDPYHNQHMGNCAELCAREENISREDQDAFAIESFKKSQKAWKEGKFQFEVVPTFVVTKKERIKVDTDEGPLKAQFDKIPTLKPAFDPQGSVTAANASTINDGAAAVVLMSGEKMGELGIKPLARVVCYATHAQRPEWFTTAPVGAIQSVLKKAHWDIESVDLFEINEAFAVVSLACQRALNIPLSKLNVWGGAIALGHPIGASGTRIVATLVSALKEMSLRRGVAGICIGGGEATALCVERI